VQTANIAHDINYCGCSAEFISSWFVFVFLHANALSSIASLTLVVLVNYKEHKRCIWSVLECCQMLRDFNSYGAASFVRGLYK